MTMLHAVSQRRSGVVEASVVNRAVGRAVRRARDEAGISQAALAARLGWVDGQALMSRYENGHRDFTVTQIRELGDALGVDPHWLVAEPWGEPPEDLSDDQSLAVQIDRLSAMVERLRGSVDE